MKKISQADENARNELISNLSKEADVVENAANEVNDRIAALNEKIAAYNNTLKNVRDFVDEVVDRMQAYHGERSEDWQESDAGSAYQEWTDAWETADFDDIPTANPIDPMEPKHNQELEELPDSPE